MQIRAVVAAAVLWASHGVAQPIQAGLDWLRLQQGPDGLLGGATAEEPIVATNEALAVWRASASTAHRSMALQPLG